MFCILINNGYVMDTKSAMKTPKYYVKSVYS